MLKETVIIDTREQNPWRFATSKTKVQTLKTGDYTLEGYEDLLVIERKGCIGEFAKNISEDRFERELERLENFKYSFIILEFNMGEVITYPIGSGVPYFLHKRIRARGPYIFRRLTELMTQYKTKIILAGSHGQDTARSIFKRVMEIERREPTRIPGE